VGEAKNFTDRATLEDISREDLLALVANSSLPPAGKRKAFGSLGVVVEYQPHQGEKEKKRRLKLIK